MRGSLIEGVAYMFRDAKQTFSLMYINRTILLTAAALLFLATLAALSFPYGYFAILRIVVCGVAIYNAIQIRNSVIPLLGLVLVAIVFNPLAPVHLPQMVGRIIYLATAASFIRLAMKPLNIQNPK